MTLRPRDPAFKIRRAFAKRLIAARIAAGFENQKDLAERINAGDEQYRRWERAETEPNLYWLFRIQEATGKSLDFLICGAEGKEAAK